VAYLFEMGRDIAGPAAKTSPGYLRWLSQVPRAEQFTSAVVIDELCKGAFGFS
jgi:hypothetical protein